jgi:hypothetical protein
VSFGRATGELALGMRDEHRAMAPFARPSTVSSTCRCPPRHVRAVSA